MRITKSGEQVWRERTAREIANTGCDKCPNCGETSGFFTNLKYGQKGGIMSAGYKSYCKGIFKMKVYRIDRYVCQTCGAGWESDPYEVG